jgi:glucose/arabinose dehydrogenase
VVNHFLSIPPVLLLTAALCLADDEKALSELNVEQVYQRLCSTCHGENLDGGLGGSLVDGVWKHGADDAEIYQSIEKGKRDLGMMPWEGVLTPQQIRVMVVFLREKEARAAEKNLKLPKPVPGEITVTDRVRYQVDPVVADGLEIPWAIAFLPDGRKLVTERPGRLRILEADGRLLPNAVTGTPKVQAHGQGGMMEVALHPDYAKNGWIYLGFSDGWMPEGEKRPKCLTAIVRGRLKELEWVDEEWIYRADKKFYGASGVHFGTRCVFKDGYVFFVVGERGGWKQAQDLSRPNGKIFRLHDDGRIPDDNPFINTPGALPGIWSYGHRNPQGLDLDPRSGDLYCTEHGARGGDELNLVRRGRNYGWPEISHGMNYNGKPISAFTAKEGMEQPVIHWTPSIAPCGLDFYRGDVFPDWKGDLFAGALKQQEVRRLRIQDQHVVEQEIILKGLGRVRDVAGGPDGALYIVLNGPDRIIRLIPE